MLARHAASATVAPALLAAPRSLLLPGELRHDGAVVLLPEWPRSLVCLWRPCG